MSKLLSSLQIKTILFVSIIVITLGYSFYQTKDFIKGPILTITEPLSGTTTTNDTISVKGFTKNISFLSINGRQIFVDTDGNLDETLLLSSGYNIIELLASDKYERETKEILEIVYKQ